LDDLDNVLASYDLSTTGWVGLNIFFANPTNLDNIKIEFYFTAIDSIGNNYPGAFVDDLVVTSDDLPPIGVPLSNWALALGLFLIIAATVIRFKRFA
jgi:hypothetical protein